MLRMLRMIMTMIMMRIRMTILMTTAVADSDGEVEDDTCSRRPPPRLPFLSPGLFCALCAYVVLPM
jgi:hypothetical protein